MFEQAQASKTREVVAQQRVLVLLEERVKLANAPIATAKAKRDKVQTFLRVRIWFRACALSLGGALSTTLARKPRHVCTKIDGTFVSWIVTDTSRLLLVSFMACGADDAREGKT